jgi:hypothetical protein
MTEQAEGYFEISSNYHQIKDQDTEYVMFCLTWNEIVAQGVPNDTKVNVIGFEVLLQKESAKCAHHITTYANEDGSDNISCNLSIDWGVHMAWAPGDYPVAFPGHTGSAWGDGGYKAIRMVR